MCVKKKTWSIFIYFFIPIIAFRTEIEFSSFEFEIKLDGLKGRPVTRLLNYNISVLKHEHLGRVSCPSMLRYTRVLYPGKAVVPAGEMEYEAQEARSIGVQGAFASNSMHYTTLSSPSV